MSPSACEDSRVRLRYGVELGYDVAGPAGFVLNVHAAKTPRQTIVDEWFGVRPAHAASVGEDGANGNRLAAFDAAPGNIVVRYDAVVEIAHRFVDPDAIAVEAPAALPPPVLCFLYPSRYCQADLVRSQAWNTFGMHPRGYGQVRAVRDWVERHVRFSPGASGPSTSALETLRDGVGVCRDYAHTMIALCRALDYPARFVTGVDYGADPALGPPDFHAYVEVLLGGDWYMFDPSGLSPVTGLLRIGTGRDAADVSFATIFGPVRTGIPRIDISADADPARGLRPPAGTELAVSTAS